MSLSMNSSSNKNKRQRKESRNKQQQQHVANYYDTIDTTEEQMLTAALFGTSTTSISSSLRNTADNQEHHKNKDTQQEKQQAFTFEIDRVGDSSNVLNKQDIDQTNDDLNDSTKLLADIRESKESGITTAKAKDPKPSTDTTDVAAWVDEDDEQVHISLIEQSDRIRKLRNERSEIGSIDGVNYQKRLRQRYMNTTQLTSNTSWANITENTDDTTKNKRSDKTDESISTSYIESSTSSSNKIPPPNQIRMKRCPDANIQDPNQSVTQVVQFHPSSSGTNDSNNGNNSNDENPLLLTAGFDKTLRFFKCNEDASTKVHGVHLPNFPIYSTSFIGSSSTVVVTGRRPFFYLYDTVADQVQRIPKLHGREEKSWERCIASPYDDRTIALLGNDGYIILYDTKRLQCRTSQPIKLNGSVRTVAFANQGNELIASGSDGDIYRFDIRSSMSKCIERFNNLDGTITSYIASSRRTFAVGAESGVVNIYAERQQQLSVAPAPHSMTNHAPLKSIMNIKTSIDMIRYNHDGNILAISSRREKDCMKLVHIPTRTVYSNWPTSQTPLGYVWSIDFSPQSKYIAIGNDNGKCLLYKLMHYE